MHQTSSPVPPTESDIFIFLRDGEHQARFSYHSSFRKTASELAHLVPGYTALRVRHGIRVLIDEVCPAGDYVLFPNIRPTAPATTQVVPQISPRDATQSTADKVQDTAMEDGHDLNPQHFPILELQPGDNTVIEVWGSILFLLSFYFYD